MWRLVAGIGGSLASLFGFKSIEYKIAKIVGLIAVVVMLVTILGIGKCSYDRSIINQYKTEERIETAEAALDADKAADDAERERLKQAEAENKRLEQAAAEAKARDPEGAAKPVGPVSQSYYDNLPAKKGTNR